MRVIAKTLKRARNLRHDMSLPEVLLWQCLRTRDAALPAFRRQHAVGPYILDFYCAKVTLAVEIDGEVHDHEGRAEHDARRDAWLRTQGIDVLRYAARDVLRDVNGVAEGIHLIVRERMGMR